MNFRWISALLVGTSFAGSVTTLSVPLEQITLARENWVSVVKYPFCSNRDAACMARVGGYTRSPNNTAWNWETFVRPIAGAAIPVGAGEITLRAHLRDLQLGAYPRNMAVYRQDLRADWDAQTVYTDFNNGDFTASPWSNPLAEHYFASGEQGWVEFKSPALAREVLSWRDPARARAGLVLSGNFYYFGYYADFDSLELRISQPDMDGNGIPDQVDEQSQDFRSVARDSIIPQSKWFGPANSAQTVTYDLSQIPSLNRPTPLSYQIPAGVIQDSALPVLIRADHNPNYIVNLDQVVYRLRAKIRPGATYAQPLPIPKQYAGYSARQLTLSSYDEQNQTWVSVPVDSMTQNALWIRPAPAAGGAAVEYVLSPVEARMSSITASKAGSIIRNVNGQTAEVKIPIMRMGATEIPLILFRKVMSKVNPKLYPVLAENDPNAHKPVVGVTFAEAILFCNNLTKMQMASTGALLDTAYVFQDVRWIGEKRVQPYLDGLKFVAGTSGYRLPKESEWTWVASKGNKNAYPWGDQWDASKAWTAPVAGAVASLHDVGSSNTLQIKGIELDPSRNTVDNDFYDLIGNADEWVMPSELLWQSDSPVPPPNMGFIQSLICAMAPMHPYCLDFPGGQVTMNNTGTQTTDESCRTVLQSAGMGSFSFGAVKGGSVVSTQPGPFLTLNEFASFENSCSMSTEEKQLSTLANRGFRVASGGFRIEIVDLDEDGIPDDEELICLKNPDQDCFHIAKDGSKASIKGA